MCLYMCLYTYMLCVFNVYAVSHALHLLYSIGVCPDISMCICTLCATVCISMFVNK